MVATSTERNWLPALLWVFALIPFIVSTAVAKQYWGFLIHRPYLDSRILEMEQVDKITPMESVRSEEGLWLLQAEADLHWQDYITHPGKTKYYTVPGRGISALANHDRIPEAVSAHTPTEMGRIYELLVMFPHEPDVITPMQDYMWNGCVAIQGRDINESELLFVALTKIVSNDHWLAREYLFQDPNADEPKLLSVNQFYFDVAGFESQSAYENGRTWFVEWFSLLYITFIYFWPIGVATALTMTLAVWATYRRFRPKRRKIDKGIENVA